MKDSFKNIPKLNALLRIYIAVKPSPANYLVENGFSSGNKIVFWTDINHTSENMAGLIGSLKAGLTIVQPEYENWFKSTQSQKKWELFSEEYLAALQLTEEQLLDKSELQMALELAITPHYQLAQNMGFKSGWIAS